MYRDCAGVYIRRVTIFLEPRGTRKGANGQISSAKMFLEAIFSFRECQGGRRRIGKYVGKFCHLERALESVN
jgi:hypothetical protein